MISKSTIKCFEDLYHNGYDKDYPSIELVRIQKKLFDNSHKNLLDFGSGHGSNGIHFLKYGFNVTFCDISKKAIDFSKKKISKFNNIKKKANFIHLKKYSQLTNIGLKKNFDVIVCMSVINNLSSIKEIQYLLNIFFKILKKKGILIIDTNYLKNNYKIIKKINTNTIITTLNVKKNNKFKMTFPNDKKHFLKILKKTKFNLLDVGHYSFKIFDSFENEDIFVLKK